MEKNIKIDYGDNRNNHTKITYCFYLIGDAGNADHEKE
jgi:hypothetical protein